MPTCFGTTPDYNRLLTALKGGKPDRVPLYEFYSNTDIQFAAIGSDEIDKSIPQGENAELNRHIAAQYMLGYDYVSPWVQFEFPGLQFHRTEEESGPKSRHFVDDTRSAIKSREDFEKYEWPTPEAVSYADIEYCSQHLPEGIKIMVNLGGGLLEWAMWLMGAEDFLLTMYDDPSLIKDVLAKINAQQVAVAKQAASHPDVMGVIIGDDMGFKTQTFLPPAVMREHIFPGLKKIADAVHSAGKPLALHSCGNLEAVMDDLIDFVGIDAKHSFEDVIMPVADVQERWGSRVALLGGVDVDFLCRAPECELRAYVRNIIEKCGPRGGYALGSGNSIADYVPAASLRVMLDEAIQRQC